MRTIISGVQRYTKIPVPILAIYALPTDWGPARANHYVFHSNEAEVLREMDAFISRLK